MATLEESAWEDLVAFRKLYTLSIQEPVTLLHHSLAKRLTEVQLDRLVKQWKTDFMHDYLNQLDRRLTKDE